MQLERPFWKGFAVALGAGFLLFCVFFTYDIIGSIANNILQEGGSHLGIGLLNGSVFLPGVITAVIAGSLVDRLGIRTSSLVFSAICFLGVCAATIGNYSSTPSVLLLGRLLFGISMEPAIVLATTFVLTSVDESKRTVAWSASLILARLGSYFGDSVPRLKIQPFSTSLILWILWLAFLALAYRSLPSASVSKPSHASLFYNVIHKRPVSYYYIVVVCCVFYAAVLTFRTFGQHILIDGYLTQIPPSNRSVIASTLMGYTSLIPLLTTVVAGWIGERFSKGIMLTAGSILLSLGFSLLIPAGVPLRLPFILIGLAYAIVPIALWPLVGAYVAKDELGSANGFMTSCQNLTIVFCLVATGFLMDHGVSDRNIPVLFATMAVIQVVVLIYIARRRNSDLLLRVRAQSAP